MRLTQAFSPSWTGSLAVGAQDLTTDDRLAYPYGCSAENKYDRYCSNGTYDLYDFRSDDESRKTYAAKASLQGKVTTGDMTHQLYLSVLSSSSRERFQKQAYNYAGVGNVEGTAIGTANPTLNDENTNRDSASNELSLAESAKLQKWTGWLGLRFTNLHRSSIRTDGSRSTDYSQNFLIPWTALSYEFENILAYASVGQGLESFVTPNKDGYTRRGEFLPDVISRQYELGLRSDMRDLGWSLAFFQIQRPVVVDQKPTYQIDGEAQHQGAEAQGYLNEGPWGLTASFMKLNAKRKDSSLNSLLNGKGPVNVPDDAVRIRVSYQLSAIKGLNLYARLSHEGTRAVLSDNSIMLPAWTRGDVGASYAQNWEKNKLLWRLTVNNFTDERYWKESPTQYGHIYLYPGEERNLLLSLQAQL